MVFCQIKFSPIGLWGAFRWRLASIPLNVVQTGWQMKWSLLLLGTIAFDEPFLLHVSNHRPLSSFSSSAWLNMKACDIPFSHHASLWRIAHLKFFDDVSKCEMIPFHCHICSAHQCRAHKNSLPNFGYW